MIFILASFANIIFVAWNIWSDSVKLSKTLCKIASLFCLWSVYNSWKLNYIGRSSPKMICLVQCYNSNLLVVSFGGFVGTIIHLKDHMSYTKGIIL
jgi:hypothetical protein